MRNCEEMAEYVFTRSSIILEEKRKKRKIRSLTLASLGICVALLLTVELANNDHIKKSDTATTSTGSESVSETLKVVSNTKDKELDGRIDDEETLVPGLPEKRAGFSLDDPRIVWGTGYHEDVVGTGIWNEKEVGQELHDALLSNEQEDKIYAILTTVVPLYKYTRYYNDDDDEKDIKEKYNDDYEYNGKTLAWYEAEYWKEREYPEKLNNLLKEGDKLKYGEKLYQPGGVNGNKMTEEVYNEKVSYYGEELLNKYIVNGEFLREKLEHDMEQPLPHSAERAWLAALNEFKNTKLNELEEYLISENIVYERRNVVSYRYEKIYDCSSNYDYQDERYYNKVEVIRPYIIIFATKDEFASCKPDQSLDLQFGLATKNIINGIWEDEPKDA